jgi:hypothetical protein
MKKNKENRKGQIQLGETTAVIIIVIILLVIGIVFWSKVSRSNITDIQSQSNELAVIEIANMVPEMTELKCYKSGVNQAKCLDWYKVLAMNASINNPNDKTAFEFYNTYFKNSKITVKRVYPDDIGTGINNVTIYDAKLNTSSRKLLISIPVNIADYVNDTVYYGFIIVEGYYN